MDTKKFKEDFIDIVMTLLKLGPSSLIGVDIGLSAVRIAEILKPKKGIYKLNRFAYQKLPEGSLIEDDILKPDEIIKALNDCFKKSGIQNKNVCIGISGPNTMSKRLQVTSGSKEEVEDQVIWESEQYIPFGVDDSTISFHTVGENEGGGIDVLVAASRNDIVESLKSILQQATLKLKIVDLELFSLANIFEISNAEEILNPDEGLLVIDAGAQTTNMIIYRNKSVIFTREMNIGGLVITEEIQRQMGLSFDEAEDLKIRGDENGNLPEEIVDIINLSLESFFTEIKKTLNFFLTATSEDGIEKCFITGGASLTPGFLDGLENNLGLKVERINPFSKITVNEKNITEDLLPYIESCGCVVLGLALREIPK